MQQDGCSSHLDKVRVVLGICIHMCVSAHHQSQQLFSWTQLLTAAPILPNTRDCCSQDSVCLILFEGGKVEKSCVLTVT